MPQYLITVGFLVAALICYVAGASIGAIALATAGLLLEAIFWIRVLIARRSPHDAEVAIGRTNPS